MEAVPGRAKPYVPGTPLPPAVTSAAAERGLGALVDVRREGVVIRMVVAGILLVLLGLVFNGMFSSMARLPAGRLGLIRPTAIFGVVLSFLMLGGGAFFAVRGILGAWRGHYLFAGGMVHRFLTTTRVATWAEIDRFAPIRNRFGDAADGRVLGYRVEVGGRKVAAVPILLTDGRDSFVDQAIARLGVRDESGAAAAASGSATAQPFDPTMTPSAVAVPSVAAQASAEPPPANVAPAPYQQDTAEQRDVVRAKNERGVVFGVLWILFGIVMTAISYSMTSAYGGVYFLYWGAVAYGIYRIVRSRILLSRLKD
jgi:hypothetical protein